MFARNGRPTIDCRILLPRGEAPIASARRRGGGRVDAVEIAQYRLHRGIQAIEVESVNGRHRSGRHPLIVDAQPFDELGNLPIAPHP